MSNPAAVTASPKISIVMAAYNEERDIAKAIESILAQTFTDWELIIVDDGSSDNTVAIIQSFAAQDDRIRLIRNETNLELSASLNRGIEVARADLIARADADDINLPQRLSKQFEFMQQNPQIDVLGTAAYLLDANGQRVNTVSYPQAHDELSQLSFLKNHFFHPSVIIRSRFFDAAGVYNPEYPNAEDKEIWLRGLRSGCRYANLSEPLIEYSTDGFVKSWRSIRKHAFSLFRMVSPLKVERGYSMALLLAVYTAAIKLGVYSPRSLRVRSPASRAK